MEQEFRTGVCVCVCVWVGVGGLGRVRQWKPLSQSDFVGGGEGCSDGSPSFNLI